MERNTMNEHDCRKLVGRDLVQAESGNVLRGPIKRVVVEEHTDADGNPYRFAEFYLEWVAIKKSTGWIQFAKVDDPELGVSVTGVNLNMCEISEDDQGVILIDLPYLGRAKILKDGESLPKEQVSGLD